MLSAIARAFSSAARAAAEMHADHQDEPGDLPLAIDEKGWLVGDGQDLRLRLAGMRQEAWREGPTCKGFPDPAQGLPGALRLV